MATRFAFALLLACAAAAAHAQGHASTAADESAGGWRGSVVPPYPSGVRELGGACIGEGSSGEAMCAVSISVVKDEQSGARTVLAIRRLHHPDGNAVGGDRPLGLVTDVLEPAVLDDDATEVAIGLCQRDGGDDSRIVAIVRPEPDIEWYTRLRGAWRVGADGRFAAIEAAGVRCLNEGYGYDG